MAQLDISVAEALIRLRAYAFGKGRASLAVAEDVVARTLLFNVEDGRQGLLVVRPHFRERRPSSADHRRCNIAAGVTLDE